MKAQAPKFGTAAEKRATPPRPWGARACGLERVLLRLAVPDKAHPPVATCPGWSGESDASKPWCWRFAHDRATFGSYANARPPPAGAWQNCGATSTHNTHRLSPQKICYRHHPFFGSEVEVVRALRTCGQAVVVIKVPAGFQVAIPTWMLDSVQCQSLRQEARPRASLAALLELLALVRGPVFPCAVKPAPAKSNDAPQIKKRLSSEQLRLSPERVVGKVSRDRSRSLPPAARAATALRGVKRRSHPEAK